jgi:hypothetical protein
LEHPLKHLQQIASKWPLEQQKIHTQLTNPIQKEPSSKKTHYKNNVSPIYQVFSLDYFEWIHSSYWKGPSEDLVVSLIHYIRTSELHSYFVMVTLTMTCQLALLCIEEVQLSWKYITLSKLPSLCAIKHLLCDDPYTQNLLSPKMDEKMT